MLFTVLAWFMVFWSTINLLDYFLRSFHVPVYMSFVDRYEVFVTFFQIRLVLFRSPCRIIKALPRNNLLSHLIATWFTVGIISAVFCSFGIIIYLSRSSMVQISSWLEEFYTFGSDHLVQAQTTNVDQMQAAAVREEFVEEDEGLKFVIPGWNIPWTEVPLYIAILLFAAVTHEVGHMLAAISTSVPVTSVGFILLAIYFGAYVEIDTATLRRLSPVQKLRISCAGVWNNLMLALFAWVLYESTSFIVSPWYLSGGGVYIEGIQKGSPLSGPIGLQEGSVVQAINDCKVNDIDDWNHCLKTMKFDNSGFCIPDDVIAGNIADQMQLIGNELDCCHNSTWNNSASHMSFYVRNWMRATHSQSCNSTENCTNTNWTSAVYNSSCVFPALLGNMSFMRISIAYTLRTVLYVGYIKELEFDVQVSNYVPRLPILSPFMPYIIELVAKYLFTFSLAFAIINATPCIYLDGQYICSNFVDCVFSKLKPRRRRLLKRVALVYGTGLLAVNFILAVWKLYKHTL